MKELYIVRLYDGFDNKWIDVSSCIPLNIARRIWNKKTANENIS